MKMFTEPVIEVTKFMIEDIVTASLEDNETDRDNS